MNTLKLNSGFNTIIGYYPYEGTPLRNIFFCFAECDSADEANLTEYVDYLRKIMRYSSVSLCDEFSQGYPQFQTVNFLLTGLVREFSGLDNTWLTTIDVLWGEANNVYTKQLELAIDQFDTGHYYIVAFDPEDQ